MKKVVWTAENDYLLSQLYMELTANEIAKKMGISKSAVKNRIHNIGIKLPNQIKQSRIAQSQFKKGHISFNKGKKQSDYMSVSAIEKTKKTRFKKGHTPHNTLNNGVITIRKDKRGVPYQFIRIDCSQWVPLHVKVWQDAFGNIPKQHNVVFKDRNTMNTEITNLELITNSELMQRNTIHRYPFEIKELIHLVKQLNKELKNYGKK